MGNIETRFRADYGPLEGLRGLRIEYSIHLNSVLFHHSLFHLDFFLMLFLCKITPKYIFSAGPLFKINSTRSLISLRIVCWSSFRILFGSYVN